MSDVMRVHIGKEEWTLVEFVDAFLSYRSRAEKAEEAVDYCNREMNNALAQVDHLKASAEKAELERDELKRRLQDHGPLCRSCEGPLTCAKCVPVKPPGIALFDDPNIVRTVLDDLDDHEARIKALAEQCDSLLGRIQLLEGKTRNLGGDGQWLVEGWR
jgi:chaperonin cofactor prefoldin